MAYNLDLPCERTGFTVAFASSRIAVMLDGGKPRERVDVLNSWHTADVVWVCTATEYEYLMAFVRVHERTAQFFTVDIVSERGDSEPHNATFVPGSVRLTGQSGDAYTVAAQLMCLAVDLPTQSEDIARITAGP